MNIYIKNYYFRAKDILISVILIFVATSIFLLIFGSKINLISEQLENYDESSYEYAYVLNYEIPEDDELIYPDTNISLYLDAGGNKRIAASCIMLRNAKGSGEGVFNNSLDVSRNVATRYGLKIDDEVYLEDPFTGRFLKCRVGSVSSTEFDFQNPVIDNGIGIVYLHEIPRYADNFKSKYILFSTNSKISTLSDYPQVIDHIINKHENYLFVLRQSVFALLIELVAFIVVTSIANGMFFRKSFIPLRRIYLKGSSISLMTVVPLIEKIVFNLLPAIICSFVMSLFVEQNSVVGKICLLMPMGVSTLYIFFSTVAAYRFYRVKKA